MDPTLGAALDSLGISGETLRIQEAAEFSAAILDDARAFMLERMPLSALEIDVVIFGSYARGEASLTSDFDYLIIPHSLPAEEQVRCTRDFTHAVQELIESLSKTNGLDVAQMQPGATGVFGTIQSAVDLVERIGLEQDTNTTHTRRCLLLQESRSIYAPERHEQLLRTILARYLADYENSSKPGAPRFLLNDLNRYWFTVAVDYQAKRWERLDDGWGIRYLKLLITRRISYVAGILPLLLCDEERPANVDNLLAAYQRTSLSRLADLAAITEFDRPEALAVVFQVLDRFLTILADKDSRKLLSTVSAKPVEGEAPLFDEMRAEAHRLDASLRDIFSSSLLNPKVHRYLIL